MNRSSRSLQPTWASNSITVNSRNDEERTNEEHNSSHPPHSLSSVVPPRTSQHRRSMPSIHRISTQHRAFIPSLPTTVEEPDEEMQRYAEQIHDLVQKPCPGAKSTPSRALNILRYVAGGRDFFRDVSHPEIEAFTSVLDKFSKKKRLALLTLLSNKLKHHLSRTQGISMSNALEYLRAAGTSKHEKQLIDSRLHRLQRILGELIDEIETSIRDSAPDAPKLLALEAKALITTNTDEEENGTARAIKLIYCAAGRSIYANLNQPETGACAKRLRNLPNNLRHPYLQFLYGKLESYLTDAQRTAIGECLARLTELTRRGANLEDSDFDPLRCVVKEKLVELNVKIPTYN